MPNLRFRAGSRRLAPAGTLSRTSQPASRLQPSNLAASHLERSILGQESVTVERLTKRFDDIEVLHGAELRLEPGRTVALLGPSGCGKTTLLRCIAGLERPDSGIVTVGDRVLFGPDTDVPAERRRVGMVFQDWALFPHLSVGANVGYGLRRRRDRTEAVQSALEMVGLSHCVDRAPMTLSGGQQQRVALARALATRPSVLLLDEPFSNLDATLRSSIRADVRTLLGDLGITALFVTHDQEEAFVVGDEVAVMLGGRVVQQSLPADLYTGPASRAVAEFIGDANLVSGSADGLTATTAVGSVPLRAPTHGAVDVLIRPEQLAVCLGDSGVVDRLDYYGHDAVYHVRSDNGAIVRVRVIDTPKYRPGDRVDVRFAGDPTAAFALQ